MTTVATSTTTIRAPRTARTGIATFSAATPYTTNTTSPTKSTGTTDAAFQEVISNLRHGGRCTRVIEEDTKGAAPTGGTGRASTRASPGAAATTSPADMVIAAKVPVEDVRPTTTAAATAATTRGAFAGVVSGIGLPETALHVTGRLRASISSCTIVAIGGLAAVSSFHRMVGGGHIASSAG